MRKIICLALVLMFLSFSAFAENTGCHMAEMYEELLVGKTWTKLLSRKNSTLPNQFEYDARNPFLIADFSGSAKMAFTDVFGSIVGSLEFYDVYFDSIAVRMVLFDADGVVAVYVGG